MDTAISGEERAHQLRYAELTKSAYLFFMLKSIGNTGIGDCIGSRASAIGRKIKTGNGLCEHIPGLQHQFLFKFNDLSLIE